MRLKIVNGTPCVQCVKCGRVKNGYKMPIESVYADLDGVSFRDYYCTECAAAQKQG